VARREIREGTGEEVRDFGEEGGDKRKGEQRKFGLRNVKRIGKGRNAEQERSRTANVSSGA